MKDRDAVAGKYKECLWIWMRSVNVGLFHESEDALGTKGRVLTGCVD